MALPPSLAAKKIETKTASRRKRESAGAVILDSQRKRPPPLPLPLPLPRKTTMKKRGGSAAVRFTRSVRETLIITAGRSPMTDRLLPSLPLFHLPPHLTLHGVRVELAHVDALVVELDVGDM